MPEFKESNNDAFMIGKDISALANAAAVEGQYYAYMLWGVDDNTHNIIGTTFNPLNEKHKGQELELWLRLKLSKNAEFRFIPINVDDKRLVILRIWPAAGYPVSFDGAEYVRSGTSTQPLAKNSQRERRLWEVTKSESFEEQIALPWLTAEEVLTQLRWKAYFTQSATPMPSSQESVLRYLETDHLVKALDSGQYAITNLGALLFAEDLQQYPTVSRKALRVIKYDGVRKSSPSRTQTYPHGYADMDSIAAFLQAWLPESETIGRALRVTTFAYPPIAVRELLGNMLIHQDLTIRGAGPLIEIFDNRVEFSNPGNSLISIERLVNDPPAARNPKLAALSRRLHMCEEAGSGWDKIIDACETAQLPSPEIQQSDGDSPSIMIRLSQYRPYTQLSTSERMDSCYWHACIQFADGTCLTNASLRARFGLSDSYSSQISRLIREAVHAELIKPVDPDASRKKMEYIPAWA
ncbi:MULTISPECIES: ATP-binding protein [Bifidobacterium]|uniref:ATP-binding protein n=1 Tax=Bifidobacterium TaxID=1678 RepID=UPI001BDC05BB|nr:MULTISPECIES: ATP-binding protein [Bifidobacterium]MBT1161367.1 putative DNA binding domain-containing protein [Bifidobacterium sp. SO1]MBW3079726.1 putative DNA binding domain-containing protein [Bifidobacterium simiiventris]